MNSVSSEAVSMLLEAIYFEQWLRFRWIVQENNIWCIRVPAEDAAVIGEDLPHLYSLLEDMNAHAVNAQTAYTAILEYGRVHLGDNLDRVLTCPDFQQRVTCFHANLGRISELLETDDPSFAAWKRAIDTMEHEASARP